MLRAVLVGYASPKAVVRQRVLARAPEDFQTHPNWGDSVVSVRAWTARKALTVCLRQKLFGITHSHGSPRGPFRNGGTMT